MNSYRSNSAWTGRASRTCQEAFGPYTSFDLNEPRRRTAKWPWIVWAVLMVVLAVTVVLVPREAHAQAATAILLAASARPMSAGPALWQFIMMVSFIPWMIWMFNRDIDKSMWVPIATIVVWGVIVLAFVLWVTA